MAARSTLVSGGVMVRLRTRRVPALQGGSRIGRAVGWWLGEPAFAAHPWQRTALCYGICTKPTRCRAFQVPVPARSATTGRPRPLVQPVLAG